MKEFHQSIPILDTIRRVISLPHDAKVAEDIRLEVRIPLQNALSSYSVDGRPFGQKYRDAIEVVLNGQPELMDRAVAEMSDPTRILRHSDVVYPVAAVVGRVSERSMQRLTGVVSRMAKRVLPRI